MTHWINTYFRLEAERRIEKAHPGVARIIEAIEKEYDAGRTTSISDEEMEGLVRQHIPELAR